jgi:hypothetical protein
MSVSPGLGGRLVRRCVLGPAGFARRPGLLVFFPGLFGGLGAREPCFRCAGYLVDPCCDLVDVIE